MNNMDNEKIFKIYIGTSTNMVFSGSALQATQYIILYEVSGVFFNKIFLYLYDWPKNHRHTFKNFWLKISGTSCRVTHMASERLRSIRWRRIGSTRPEWITRSASGPRICCSGVSDAR